MGNLLAIVLLVAQSQPGQPWVGPGYHHPWGWGMMGSGWGIFMMLFMLLFWGAIVVGIVFLIRYLIHSRGGTSSEDALDILKKRYAKGEIEKAEFEEKRKDLVG